MKHHLCTHIQWELSEIRDMIKQFVPIIVARLHVEFLLNIPAENTRNLCLLF